MDEEEVLDWLTDPDQLETSDHIERINRKMFERVLQRSDFLAVLFCNYFSPFTFTSICVPLH